jgi:hypothetical protein
MIWSDLRGQLRYHGTEPFAFDRVLISKLVRNAWVQVAAI